MKWSPVLGSCICVCVCVRECCDFTSVDRGEKKKSKSRYISGAKYSSTLQWGTELQNNTYIDTVVKLWVTRLYLELWLVFGDILEPQKDQINSAR